MNTKPETEKTAVSVIVKANAEKRAAANEKRRAVKAAANERRLTANQRQDRFGSLDGVGVVPVTGQNGVTSGYAVAMLVSETKANGRTRRAMVTLQEALEGAKIYAADFNKWTKRVFNERFIALIEASKFAKYAGMSLLPREAEDLPDAEKAYKKWKDEKSTAKKAAVDMWGRLSESLERQSNGTEKTKWLFDELLKNLPEGCALEEELKAIRSKIIDAWINK